MSSLKLILGTLFGTYLITFGLLVLTMTGREPEISRNLANSPDNKKFMAQTTIITRTLSPSEFINTTLTYKILTELDIFEANQGSNSGDDSERTDNEGEDFPYLGLTSDKNYCEIHRAEFVSNPKIVFNEINFLAGNGEIIREDVLKPIGNDIHPEVSSGLTRRKRIPVELDPKLTIFFTKMVLNGKDIGRHFSCLSQTSNHIPANKIIISKKDKVAEAIIQYGQQYQDRPQCFSNDKFFPKTWLLYDKKDCQDFFKALNSREYQELKAERRIVYIRKSGGNVHMGRGVQPINDQEEADLKSDYGNGELCGKVSKSYLVQHYIYNPLLLEGRKFDFRMYMLVASANPLIAYYHDGFLRVSVPKYDPYSDDKKVLLTNIALSKEIYSSIHEGTLYNGMDEDELRNSQQWNFARLQAYLLETGVMNDPNWLDNYLRPEFKKAMIHLIRMQGSEYKKVSSGFQLYGVDLMLDSNLNLWFIEANSSPGIGTYSPKVFPVILQVYRDEVEIAIGLLRSRMKRVVNYVNNLIKGDLVQVGENGEVFIEDIAKRREEFQTITRNYFEKEFEPSPNNSFSKIIDENFEGVARYQGWIKQECI